MLKIFRACPILTSLEKHKKKFRHQKKIRQNLDIFRTPQNLDKFRTPLFTDGGLCSIGATVPVLVDGVAVSAMNYIDSCNV